MSPDPSRWLVTINGRAPSDHDCRVLNQYPLALQITCHGIRLRAEFETAADAERFHKDASREFPEDDVRLWTSVETTSERESRHATQSAGLVRP